MLEELRRSVFYARKKTVATALLATAIIIIAGIVTVLAVLWTAMNAPHASNPASQAFSNTAKIQTIADGLQCVKQGAACSDFDADTKYLQTLIQDSAEYADTSGPSARLAQTPAGWKEWASRVVNGTLGSPQQFNENGQTVSFTWGTNAFEATFVTSGSDQRLNTIAKVNHAQ